MRTNASLYAREPVITPERKVWRAVLGLAYEDAELALFNDGTEPVECVRARASCAPIAFMMSGGCGPHVNARRFPMIAW